MSPSLSAKQIAEQEKLRRQADTVILTLRGFQGEQLTQAEADSLAEKLRSTADRISESTELLGENYQTDGIGGMADPGRE